MYSAGATVLGAMAGIVPAAIGVFAFLNPLTRRPSSPASRSEATGDAKEGYTRICALDALTVGGPPQRFPVIADQRDAWNFVPEQPVGAVYVERTGDDALRVFNTTCPHAGCSVSCDGKAFNCPCHNSAFNLDGTKLTSDSGRENPSPRGLDSLEFDVLDGDVWVQFQNFYTGREHKEAKS